MKNIKKLLFTIAFFSVLITPFFVSAATIEELQTQIAVLSKQIAELQTQIAQLKGEPTEWCHDFNVNLKIGDEGTEVKALWEALERAGFGAKEGFYLTLDGEAGMGIVTFVFGERTASAVVAFQQKYKDEILTPLGLQYGTGYVGKATRAKLNKLYGCGIKPPVCIQVITPAQNPQTGECRNFPTPCDVPSGWIKVPKCEKPTPGEKFVAAVVPGNRSQDMFIVSITDPTTIQQARDCYANRNCGRHISGKIAAGNGGFNTNWSWHLIPDTVQMPQLSMEVCDGVPNDVERQGVNFDAGIFCPWGSFILALGGQYPLAAGANQPPVISGISGPTALKVNETGTWTIRASDPEQGVLSYSVLWGDETTTGLYTPAQRNWSYTQTATFTHSFSKAGAYNPTFTVTDDKGLSAKTSISVNVGETPISCTDSDGGKNYYVKGTVTKGNVSYTDECAYCTGLLPSPVTCGAVKEYYCEGNEIKSETFVCPGGYSCKDGACISATAPSITTTSLSSGTVGTSYSTSISASGGSDSYVWSVSSGTLPPGLSLSNPVCIAWPCQAPASISGTPTTAGSYTFTVTVKSGTLSASKQFTIIVNAVVTPSITVLSPNGGERWTAGTVQTIKWNSNLVSIPEQPITFDIFLASYCVPGQACIALAPYTIVRAVSGLTYNWKVGSVVSGGSAPAGSYLVKICQSGTTNCDQSDAGFSIVAGGVGLENIENQLASIANAISQLMEGIKELIAR